MEAPSTSGNPAQPTKGRRVELPPLPPPLPESCTNLPFVLDLIRKNNAAITHKNRLKSKQQLTTEAVRQALLLKDVKLGEDIIRDSITARNIFPKVDVSITPILHGLHREGEFKRGVDLFNWVIDAAKAAGPEREKTMLDDSILTVGLRLVQAAGGSGEDGIDTSNTEIKRLLARVPKEMMKRRLLNTVVAGCIPDNNNNKQSTATPSGTAVVAPDWDLMLHVLEVGMESGQEFWDKDFLTMLEVVEACDLAGIKYPKKTCMERILAAMEDHHPTVGKNVAAKLCLLASTVVTSSAVAEEEETKKAEGLQEKGLLLLASKKSTVDLKTGVCSKCETRMQGFTFSDNDFSRLEKDILDKLVEPSYSRLSHYEKHTKEAVPEAEQKARRERFAEFSKAVHSSEFDSLIDGANVGYYGVTNWYSGDKIEQLVFNGRDRASIKPTDVGKMPLPIDICPRFGLIDRVLEEAIRLGYNPKVVLHERHVVPSHRLFGENAQMIQKWKATGRLLDSPPFLNDDYCWLYACSVKKKCMLITNDQMRDHHFKMLSQRNFIRWRQRHRIQFRNGMNGLRVILPTMFSTWVQRSELVTGTGDNTVTRWHIPYLDTPVIEQDTNKGLQEHALGKDGDDGCDAWACLEL